MCFIFRLFIAVQADFTLFVLSRQKCHLEMEIPHIIGVVPSVWGSRDGASSFMQLGASSFGNPPNLVMEMPDGFELRGQAESTGLIHLQNHSFMNFANSTLWIPSWLPKMQQCALVSWLTLHVRSWDLVVLPQAFQCHRQTSHLPSILQQLSLFSWVFI